jgi:hypothetical protein
MSNKEKYSVVKTEVIEQSFYIVRNQYGKYLRSKGYMGSGNNWVDDIGRARIYSKPHYAQTQINFWYSKYPDHGKPDLIRVSGVTVEILAPNKEYENEKLAKIEAKKAKENKREQILKTQEKERRFQEYQKLKKEFE